MLCTRSFFFFVFVRLRPRFAVERSAEHGRRNETSRKRVTPLWTLPGQVAMNHTVYCGKSCFLEGPGRTLLDDGHCVCVCASVRRPALHKE